jgi:hypothetical protein
MDFHLLKIDVLPLETKQLADSKAREYGDEDLRPCRFLQNAKQCSDLVGEMLRRRRQAVP